MKASTYLANDTTLVPGHQLSRSAGCYAASGKAKAFVAFVDRLQGTSRTHITVLHVAALWD